MTVYKAIKLLKSAPALRTMAQMGVISGPLGMMLDNQHGLFNVLTYKHLEIVGQWSDGRVWLRSAQWVPPTFALAGVIMTALILCLDQIWMDTSPEKRLPSWPRVWCSISFFSAQYWLSGAMDSVEAAVPTMHITLMLLAVTGWELFDASAAGLVLGMATALSGPAVEALLINTTDLYHYTHADVAGVCSWIPWVYFLGEAGVGNLARRLYHHNCAREAKKRDA